MARQTTFRVELGGESRLLNFGMVCWEFFCEEMNVSPTDILNIFQGPKTFRSMRVLVSCAIKAHDYLAEAPTEITEVQIAGWLNDEPEKMEQVFTLAMTCLIPEEGAEPIKNTPSKKKKVSASKKSKK